MNLDKAQGILLGLAVGDALGTTLEFGPRRSLKNLHTEIIGKGPFNLKAGEWTDDTAMAIGLAESLINKKEFDPIDILTNWSDWYTTGKHSCTGTCFDIGISTRNALDSFIDTKELPEISDESKGNGSLMRLGPIVIFSKDYKEVEELSYKQALLTHSSPTALLTGWFGKHLYQCAEGHYDKPKDFINKSRNQISSSGYYLNSLHAAQWAVANTDTFEDAVIQAVNLGDDADTVGAIAGQLAGAIYGFRAIPERWLEKLAWNDYLLELSQKLLTH